MTPTDLQRFLEKVDTSGDCWLWTACSQDGGYGRFRAKGETHQAHRLAYEHYIGPIPDGLEIDHLCRVRGCVNPAHLEAVTHAENVRRGNSGINNRSKVKCAQGHDYAGANLWIHPSGKRVCRKCKAEWQRAYRARKAGV